MPTALHCPDSTQPLTTVDFSKDCSLEILSSFPPEEDSSSLETDEAMPCATCQNHSNPWLSVQQLQCPHFQSSLCCHGSSSVFPKSPLVLCAQISLWSFSTHTRHYPNTDHNPICKARNNGRFFMELQLHKTHDQAMGAYKLCKPSDKGLYLYWNSSIPQKYSSKSTSLLLKSTCICGSGQLSSENSDNQHRFTFGWLPTPQTWHSRGVSAKTKTWPVPAGEHRDQSRGTVGTWQSSGSFE